MSKICFLMNLVLILPSPNIKMRSLNLYALAAQDLPQSVSRKLKPAFATYDASIPAFSIPKWLSTRAINAFQV